MNQCHCGNRQRDPLTREGYCNSCSAEAFAFIVLGWATDDALTESIVLGVFDTEGEALEHIKELDGNEPERWFADSCIVEQWERGGDRINVFDTHVVAKNEKRTITLEARE